MDKSIVAVDFDVFLQKRVIPKLNSTQNYTIAFGESIEPGTGDEALQISPSFATYDAAGNFSSSSVQITISNNITPPPVLAPDITPPTVGIQQISTNCPQPIPCNITDLQLRNYFIGYDID